MWVLKILLEDKNGIFGWRCKKFKVKTYSYRTGYYTKSKQSYLTGIILLEGNEKNKQDYIKSLKEDKSIKKLELNGDLINCLVSEPLFISKKRAEKLFYSLELINIKPILINENGIEFWEIGSWDKELLQGILKIARKYYNGKLIYFKQLKLSEADILFFSLYPKLTQKQKQAFLLALKEGYYEFPRKIELKKLAGLIKLSYTTYQFHLRKAERKIMNSVGSKV